MNDTLFPTKGQFFGVVFADGTDRSYREDVWECVASDEYRIVAKALMPCDYKKSIVFYRADWLIQPVSDAVIAAIQVAAEMRELQIAERKAQQA